MKSYHSKSPGPEFQRPGSAHDQLVHQKHVIIIHLGPGFSICKLHSVVGDGGGKVSFLTPQGSLGKSVGNLVFTVTEWRRIVLSNSEARGQQY